MTVLTSRLKTQTGSRLVKTGRKLTEYERRKYGKTARLRYIAGSNEPIYPIGYVQHKIPMAKKNIVTPYTAAGRMGIHNNLQVNTHIMWQMMKQPLRGRTVEYADNRISLFSAQWGKCAITGIEFTTLDGIHCHHITPKSKGGTDKYQNLMLVLLPVHKLIHATSAQTIDYYLKILNLTDEQINKVNKLREKIGNAKI